MFEGPSALANSRVPATLELCFMNRSTVRLLEWNAGFRRGWLDTQQADRNRRLIVRLAQGGIGVKESRHSSDGSSPSFSLGSDRLGTASTAREHRRSLGRSNLRPSVGVGRETCGGGDRSNRLFRQAATSRHRNWPWGHTPRKANSNVLRRTHAGNANQFERLLPTRKKAAGVGRSRSALSRTKTTSFSKRLRILAMRVRLPTSFSRRRGVAVESFSGELRARCREKRQTDMRLSAT